MMFVSFTVNSIRTRLHQLEAVINALAPDFIGLQETKVQDHDFPVEAIRELGYHVHFHGQKTHYGVALLSKVEPEEVVKGYPWDGEDSQRRLITGHFNVNGEQLTVINGYFPQGESRDHPVKFPAKEKFYADLMRYLDELKKAGGHVVVMGDMNISPTDKDIGIGADNAKRWLKTGKCSFLPEEREWLKQLTDWGLVDTYRHHADSDDHFSWFDYRSRGFEREPRRGLRIDFILATQPLAEICRDADIDYAIRAMEKPSDHCPVWADFDI